ncbi:uncharacterized protein LOC128546036 isoform X2 [Mercenaria mercenaria]|uniref:uncharacterized protein LOC128546036 isoform X2 n=1 Tax=Mercenaria mercenaria TaxID=6596 RepID=UPI00234F10F8|nr:uncharacterized protein LOC128546036 isoform X2 [Mercenaria mercenaria]
MSSRTCVVILVCTAVGELVILVTLVSHWRIARNEPLAPKQQQLCFPGDKFGSKEETERCPDGLKEAHKEKENVTVCCGDFSIVLDKLVSKVAPIRYKSDTNPGCRSAWHGQVDMLLENNDIGIQVFPEEDEDLSSAERTSAEEKVKCFDSIDARDQALAQTITFSFLQKQRCPARQHFLTPFIAASNKRFKIFFYDAENDILLESRDFSFTCKIPKDVIDFEAVIAVWFALHYKFLCSGPTEMILKAPLAKFFEFAKERIAVYESKLRFRNVYGEKNKKDVTDYDKLETCTRLQFIWLDTISAPIDI